MDGAKRSFRPLDWLFVTAVTAFAVLAIYEGEWLSLIVMTAYGLLGSILFWGLEEEANRSRAKRGGQILVIFTCLSLLFFPFLDDSQLRLARIIFGFFFLLCMTPFLGFILMLLFKARQVNPTTIMAGLSGYLMLALLWSAAYQLIFALDPAAFNMGGAAATSKEAAERFSGFYFSLVTITTLGYGDVTPVSGLAKTLAALEAVTGQAYIAILIARLVGLEVAQRMLKK